MLYDQLLKNPTAKALAVVISAAALAAQTSWRSVMERHEVLTRLKALKLRGMAAILEEVFDIGIQRKQSPVDILIELLLAETGERHVRRNPRLRLSCTPASVACDSSSCFEPHVSKRDGRGLAIDDWRGTIMQCHRDF